VRSDAEREEDVRGWARAVETELIEQIDEARRASHHELEQARALRNDAIERARKAESESKRLRAIAEGCEAQVKAANSDAELARAARQMIEDSATAPLRAEIERLKADQVHVSPSGTLSGTLPCGHGVAELDVFETEPEGPREPYCMICWNKPENPPPAPPDLAAMERAVIEQTLAYCNAPGHSPGWQWEERFRPVLDACAALARCREAKT